jgi:hypothetical protein
MLSCDGIEVVLWQLLHVWDAVLVAIFTHAQQLNWLPFYILGLNNRIQVVFAFELF